MLHAACTLLRNGLGRPTILRPAAQPEDEEYRPKLLHSLVLLRCYPIMFSRAVFFCRRLVMLRVLGLFPPTNRPRNTRVVCARDRSLEGRSRHAIEGVAVRGSSHSGASVGSPTRHAMTDGRRRKNRDSQGRGGRKKGLSARVGLQRVAIPRWKSDAGRNRGTPRESRPE